MNTITNLWEYFINFAELILFVLFISSKLSQPAPMKHRLQKQFVFLSLCFFIQCILNLLDISSLITILVICFFDICFVLIFYADPPGMKIFWSSMYSVICMVAEHITLLIPHIFSKVNIHALLLGGKLRVPFTLLYITLIAVLVFLFQYIANKKIQLTFSQKCFYLCISIAGISIAHYILLITLELATLKGTNKFTNGLILVNLFFMLLFLSLLLYTYLLGKSKEQNLELLQQQKIHELEELEYQNLIKNTETLREIKHDMEIHLDVIQTLATDNKLKEMISYIENYHCTLKQMHYLISTGNTAIDCILSNKINIARKLNIDVSYSVIIPKTFPLEPLALSSLLGNLWNNSIEACQRLHEKEGNICPQIQFYIKPFQDMILMHIENSYDGTLKPIAHNLYASLKPEKGHGIGLKRIQTIVKDANGMIQIQTSKTIFSVHILLPQKEESYENDNNCT